MKRRYQNADSVNELRLQIKLKSSRANPQLNSNSALSFDQAIAEKAKDAEEEKTTPNFLSPYVHCYAHTD